MNIPYTGILLFAFTFGYARLPAQVISWIDHSDDMNGVWETLYLNGLSTFDGTGVMCAFQSSIPNMRIYDWEGTVVNELPMPRRHFLRQIDEGHIVAGSFQSTADLLGTPLVGGAGPWDVYLARLHADGTVDQVINSVSHSGPNIFLTRIAASPSGRVAMLFGPGGAHQWGMDTIPELSAGRSLLVFDENGTLLWSKRMFSGSNNIYWFSHAEIAINDAGDVWFAGMMPHDVIIDTDTIASLTPYNLDHMIAHFSPVGEMTGHMVVAGHYPGPGITARSLLAWPDGRVFWGGDYRAGTVVGDSALADSGGLLMEIDADMIVQGIHTLNSEGNESFSAISGDPATNIIRLGGVCGKEAMFENGSLDIDAAYTAFIMERDLSGGVISWVPLLYTNDTINGFIWPLNVVERNGVIHTNGYRNGQVRRMNGSALPTGDGFLIRLDDAGSVGLMGSPMSSSEMLICWPSPTRDLLNVALDMEGPVSYRIVAADGRVLDQGRMSADTGSAQLFVGHLATGTYHFQMMSAERIAVSRFVVDRDR